MPHPTSTVEYNYDASNLVIEDMLGKPPSWLLRSGTGVILLFTLLILGMSWFVQYPDKLEGKALIQTAHPPVEIVSSFSANIDQLLIADGSEVNQGTALFILESGANWHDIFTLKEWLNEGKDPLSLDKPLRPNKGIQNLGPVSSSYNSYNQLYEEYLQTLNNEQIAQKIKGLEIERTQLNDLFHSLERQESIYVEEFDLLKKDFKRADLLLSSKTISEFEWEQKKNAYLKGKQRLEQYQAEKIQNQIGQEQLSARILDLKQERKLKLEEQHQILQNGLKNLQQAVADWEQKYIIRSPGKGLLSWNSIAVQGNYLASGKPVGVLSPKVGHNPIIIKGWMPATRIGELKLGNQVQFQLDKYPPEEYGVLEGSLSKISSMPEFRSEYNMAMYELIAEVDTPLITNYKVNIPFEQSSSGNLLIIAEEKRLLERLLDKIKFQVK